jgi:DNA-binding transcriptional MerR regulator
MTKANLRRLEEGKLYYSISEVCGLTGLEQHVLRYWESEFPQLRPKKNRSGNRAYRTKEIKIIRYIKYLLYEEMYTIPGAKKKMADMNMADLDGQLSLLRVPASPSPAKEPQPPSAPPSAQMPEAAPMPASTPEVAPSYAPILKILIIPATGAKPPPSCGKSCAASSGNCRTCWPRWRRR